MRMDQHDLHVELFYILKFDQFPERVAFWIMAKQVISVKTGVYGGSVPRIDRAQPAASLNRLRCNPTQVGDQFEPEP
jgi:hypothetical protein